MSGLSRRSLLLGGLGLGLGLGALRSRPGPKPIPGRLLGPNASLGHRLRDGETWKAPGEVQRTGIVIVGGGMAGLSAAWWLRRQGFQDFRLLEMEKEVGGNSRYGSNGVSAYPWGAHYVPLPGEDAHLVKMLFREVGLLRDGDRYEETHLCAEPQERLLIRGQWQEGLVPQDGIGPRDKEQYNAFFGRAAELRSGRGRDGRRPFSIPVDLSSGDSELRELDRISFGKYLRDHGWDSPYLKWYADYCCLDDYGCTADETSAWAGLHYFASRSGRAVNAEPETVLTWPEGNGWLVRKLEEKNAEQIRAGRFVTRLGRAGREHEVLALDVAANRMEKYRAKAILFAGPQFIARRLMHTAGGETFTYAPWMVANATVDFPLHGHGAPLSWDNVKYGAESLGYINATHQSLSGFPGRRTVLTCYFPLTDRKAAIATPAEAWKTKVAGELERMHPGIRAGIENIDVWVWGHAMVRPVPGFFTGEDRARALMPKDGIYFAHSDLSGLSLFEEAQYRGVKAAEGALKYLGLPVAGVG